MSRIYKAMRESPAPLRTAESNGSLQVAEPAAKPTADPEANSAEIRMPHVQEAIRVRRDPNPPLPVAVRQELLKLVQRLFVFPNSHAPRSMVFSSVDGNGSNDICNHIAEALAAQVSSSVCLVSDDLTLSYSRAIEAGQEGGFLAALEKQGPINNFVLPTQHGNLWLLPFGSGEDKAQNVLPLDRLRSRMADLKRQFGYVLIAAPPISASSNTILLGQMADGAILIVEADSTRHDSARLARDAFQQASVKVLGAILNRHTPV